MQTTAATNQVPSNEIRRIYEAGECAVYAVEGKIEYVHATVTYDNYGVVKTKTGNIYRVTNKLIMQDEPTGYDVILCKVDQIVEIRKAVK